MMQATIAQSAIVAWRSIFCAATWWRLRRGWELTRRLSGGTTQTDGQACNLIRPS